MNREIKFRAWDIEAKKMRHIIMNLKYALHGLIACQWCDGATLDNHWLENNADCVGGKDRFILMQYTGLHDSTRNKEFPGGREIYEGDICKIHIFTQELGENMGVMEGEREFVAEICFDCICGLSVKNSEGDSGPLYMYNGFEDSEEQITIIGNIHQTPNLLETDRGVNDEL